MGRQIAFLAILVFGYSLILGENADQSNNATTEETWNETSPNNTTEQNTTFGASENPNTTNPDTAPFTGSTPYPPPETTAGSNLTSQGPLLNGTGSPSSSSLKTGSGAQGGSGGQRFDTASFIGGIILAVGVVALGVFLVKVYQSRKGPRSEYNNI